jgi:hypothetical protein
MRGIAMAAALALLGGAGGAAAQGVPTEVTRLGTSEVTLHLHPALAAEDRDLLRVIAGSADALAAMVGSAGGHAAIALAPAEGLMRDGAPSASAFAIGQLPDAAAARRAALEGCAAARQRGPDCVVVLEIAPAR